MVRFVLPTTAADFREPPITPLAIGFFISITAMVALCTKHRRTVELRFGCFRAEKNIETSSVPNSPKDASEIWPGDELRMNLAPESPLASPRLLLMALTQKAMAVFHMKSTAKEGQEAETGDQEEGVWKRQILMGERCQPPDFSGVIYYDHTGRQLQDYLSPRSDGNNSAASDDISDVRRPNLKVALRPVGSPRVLFASLSRKASSIFNQRKPSEEAEDIDGGDGLWKRRILMGDRCRPPDFSGAIYYDHTGKPLPELPPKSPASLSIPAVATPHSDL